jgi:hypothetical protein
VEPAAAAAPDPLAIMTAIATAAAAAGLLCRSRILTAVHRPKRSFA